MPVPDPQGLSELLLAWNRVGPPRPADLFDRPTRVDVPEQLAETVTIAEPFRTQTLDDARLYLSFPGVQGLALEVELGDSSPEPFEDWQVTVARMPFRITWSRDMSGQTIDYVSLLVDRVALEGDQWKLVSLWSDEDRKKARDDAAKLEAFARSRKK